MSRTPSVLRVHAFRPVTYKGAEKYTEVLLSVGRTFYVQCLLFVPNHALIHFKTSTHVNI
jgi:hypothetical protein